MKKFIPLLVILGLFLPVSVLAVSCTDSCNSYDSCKSVADACSAQISTLQSQANTLSKQIASFNAQIRLTEVKILQTQDQIKLLVGRIDQLEVSLQDLNKAFSARAVATYKMARADEPVYMLFSANDLGDAVSKFHYLRQIQNYDQTLLGRLQSAQDIYKTNKQQSEELQKQLQTQEDQLNVQKNSKARLLADTQGNEVVFQKLLGQAQAQIAAFSAFTANQGGASLLSNQTDCSDSWGCYYNQRDTGWGGLALNNTQYSIASDGCLVTSMAMILTHYGHKNVTPISINSNPENFASYYPAYLNYVIHVDGVTATRAVSAIDSVLSSGNPVVVGINAYGGTHFVVVKSGSNGNYVMNDPFIPNGKNMNFTDHYSISSIFEVDSVSIN